MYTLGFRPLEALPALRHAADADAGAAGDVEGGPAPTGGTCAGTAAGGQRVAAFDTTDGQLYDERGEPLLGLYGAGLAFIQDEYTSGEQYAQAGFAQFAARGEEVAEAIVSRRRPTPGGLLRYYGDVDVKD